MDEKLEKSRDIAVKILNEAMDKLSIDVIDIENGKVQDEEYNADGLGHILFGTGECSIYVDGEDEPWSGECTNYSGEWRVLIQ